MCTIFEKSGNRFSLLKNVLLTAIVISTFFFVPKDVVAQANLVSVNIAVMPPYTSSLYDYINTPNKIVITLTHTDLSYPEIQLYLRASIISEKGIRVTTEQGYKPSEPIVLSPGKMYRLTNENISEAFSLKHTIIEGTDLSELLSGAGLPEDYYQICVQAFDYNTDQPLSGDQPIGCSNLFNVTNLEPPHIGFPLCGDEIVQTALQLVTINWTTPSGALPGTKYNFEMVEIPENSTIDPMEAFESTTYPLFFEETTSLNQMLLTVQKALLSPGYTYAFRVQAIDPNERLHFRNEGYSEICYFKYKEKERVFGPDEKNIRFVMPAYNNIDSVLTANSFGGLHIAWRVEPFDTLNYHDPLDDFPGCHFNVEFFDSENGKQPIYASTTVSPYLEIDNSSIPFVDGKPYWVQVSIENKVSKEKMLVSERNGFRFSVNRELQKGYSQRTLSGILKYQFENEGADSYPASYLNLNMKCIYLLTDKNSGKQYEIPEDDVVNVMTGGLNSTRSYNVSIPNVSNETAESKDQFPTSITREIVASTVTSFGGSFSFNYAWPDHAPLGEVSSSFTYTSSSAGTVTGTLERTLRIEITNPYYSSPQTVITNNFETFDLGEVTTYVYSYQLNAYLTKGYKMNSKAKEILAGKKIYLFRKEKSPGIPQYEGENLSRFSLVETPAELKYAGYYVVAVGKTETSTTDKGETVAQVVFPRLIENLVIGDQYYWYVEGMGLASAQSFSYTDNLTYTSQSKKLNYRKGFQTMTNNSLVIEPQGKYSFIVSTELNVISSDPPMSEVKGRLVYELSGEPGNLRPLANRRITIISCLVDVCSNKIVKNYMDESKEEAFSDAVPIYSDRTDANGNFGFKFPNIDFGTHDPVDGTYNVSTGKLNRDQLSWDTWESDKEANLRLKYEPKRVKVKRVFRIVVDDPSKLFLSPDDNIEVKPLENVDLGTLTSKVMCFKVSGSILGTYFSGLDYTTNSLIQTTNDANAQYQSNYLGEKPVPNVDCYVLRKKSDVSAYNLPTEEGQNVIGDLDEYPDFKVIAKTTSGSPNGDFTFENLLFQNSLSTLYFYFKTKDMIGSANYEPLIESQGDCMKPFLKPFYAFNSDYDHPSFGGATEKLMSAVPTIKGKVISNVTAGEGLKNAKVKAVFHFGNHFIRDDRTVSCLSDAEGYFDFAKQFEEFNQTGILKQLKSVDIEISKSGYHYQKRNVRTETYKNSFDKSLFARGKQVVLPNVTMYANGHIKGRIVDELGNGVNAYVQFLGSIKIGYQLLNEQREEGTMVQTKTGQDVGFFELPAIPGDNQKLVVIPKDVGFFSDTISVNVKENEAVDLGRITVYERSHRIIFDVRSTKKASSGKGNQTISNAKVELIGSPVPIVAYSDRFGIVRMSFKNVSESNLSVRISGPQGTNYVPQIVSFTNYESDRFVKLPTVFLEQGLTVKGKVLLDGKPTSEAEIYVELNSLDTELGGGKSSQGENVAIESQPLFKAYPASDGTFEISTIPPELNGKNIFLKAIYKKASSGSVETLKDFSVNEEEATSTTVVGAHKMINVSNTTGDVVLEMKTYDGMEINNLFGFPIDVTSLIFTSDKDLVYVSGRVKLDGYCPGFDPLEPLILEVSKVRYRPMQLDGSQKTVGVPDQNEVFLCGKRNLKMKYGKAFNVKLTAPENRELTLKGSVKGISDGKLSANVAIVDNSFQYPSSYLNFDGTNFNLCEKRGISDRETYLNPDIVVFDATANGDGSNLVKYNLCNLSSAGKAEDLKFKFINFNTKAVAANSTIEGSEISLDATLNAKVKDAGNIGIRIEKLVLKNNAIDPQSGNTPVEVELIDGGVNNADKTWKFEARNWRIDPKVGGLVSEDCVLHTGTIDVPYSYFNLRSDFAYFGAPQTTNINIGGYPISFQNGASVSTGYNPSCGSDRKGHWQVIFYPGSGGKIPGRVKDLPNMGGVDLDLETVSLLSNGENVFSVGTGASKMKLYNTVQFKPQTVYSLSDGFVLAGATSFHIPRVREGVGAQLKFTKNASSNDKNPSCDPIDLGFDGKGNIVFKVMPTLEQTFDKNKNTFTCYGTVEEPGVLDPVKVIMTYHGGFNVSNCWTEIHESPKFPTQVVKIGEKDNTTFLEQVKCHTKADQNDWDLFVFEGDLSGAKNVSAQSNKHMVFTVHGEINAKQDGFKADGINTPFDGMQITYQKGRLIGTLNLTNVLLGPALVNGVANVLMDSDGWAFYSNCRASEIPAPDPCSLNMGILIGDYPKVLPEMKNTVLQYAIKKEMPSTFSKGLHGFYMVGGRELPISGLDIGIKLIVVSAYARVPFAGVDASFYGNYVNGNMDMGLDVYGGIRIEFGLGSITCTELSGFASAEVGLFANVKNGKANLTGSAGFSTNLTVSQGVWSVVDCIDAISLSVPVAGSLQFKSNPFDVQFHLK